MLDSAVLELASSYPKIYLSLGWGKDYFSDEGHLVPSQEFNVFFWKGNEFPDAILIRNCRIRYVGNWISDKCA